MKTYYILTGKNSSGVHEYLFGDYNRGVVVAEHDEYKDHPGNSSEYSELIVHALADDSQERINHRVAALNPKPAFDTTTDRDKYGLKVFPSEGSISESTLRSPDLLRAFATELMRYRTVYPSSVLEAEELVNNWSDDISKTQEQEAEAIDILEELTNELISLAGDDLYFGTTEGDGACFGFWTVYENEDGELCTDPENIYGSASIRQSIEEDRK